MTILRKNDRIHLIAPASGTTPDILFKTKEALESWGLDVHTPKDLLGRTLFCSNTAEMRFQHLQTALADPDCQLIWSLRGGYGSAQLIPLLEKMPKPSKHTWLMGFSDITALHLFFQQTWHWPTIHGPQAASQIDVLDSESIAHLKSFLMGPQAQTSFADLAPLNAAAQDFQKISAPIVGGNLSLLQTSIGTSWQLQAQDKIVLMEETGERPYRTDRMLLHLMQSQVLKGAKAILLGDFNKSEDPSLTEAVLQNFADSLPIPVLRIPHVGHGASNWPVVMGREATIKHGKKFLELLMN